MADPTKVTAFRTLRGHTASVQSVAAHPSGDMVSYLFYSCSSMHCTVTYSNHSYSLPYSFTFLQVCSGSWDCRINLWQTKESNDGDNLVSTKKRKKEGEGGECQSEVLPLSGS